MITTMAASKHVRWFIGSAGLGFLDKLKLVKEVYEMRSVAKGCSEGREINRSSSRLDVRMTYRS